MNVVIVTLFVAGPIISALLIGTIFYVVIRHAVPKINTAINTRLDRVSGHPREFEGYAADNPWDRQSWGPTPGMRGRHEK